MIVLISGRKRSGKDRSAEVLINDFGFTRYGFADPIKMSCKEIFLLSDEQVDGDLKEVVDVRWGMSPREMFQLFGTDLMREQLGEIHAGYAMIVGQGLWVKRFIELYKLHPKDYVITDCRFPNELSLIRNYFKSIDDVISIRIERDGVDKSDTHPSETQIDSLDVDYVVHNNSDIATLHRVVGSIISDHL